MNLYIGDPETVKKAISNEKIKLETSGKKVGIIDFNGDINEAAYSFFRELRRLDSLNLDVILAAGVPELGIGVAVMDRMRKAAAENIKMI